MPGDILASCSEEFREHNRIILLQVAVWKRSSHGKCIMPVFPSMATISVLIFRRTLQIRTLPASDDLVEVEFPLYRKYQMLHHGEDPAEVCHASLIFILPDDGSLCAISGSVRYVTMEVTIWVFDQVLGGL